MVIDDTLALDAVQQKITHYRKVDVDILPLPSPSPPLPYATREP